MSTAGQPAEDQEYSQDYTYGDSWQDISNMDQFNYQFGMFFEVLRTNDLPDEQHVLGDPTQLSHHAYLNQPGAVSSSSLATQDPAITPPATQPPIRPTRGRKFPCVICGETFDRAARAENCRNRHSGHKPHKCLGQCGNRRCFAAYASIEKLNRHLKPLGPCKSCRKVFSKQNMARHKRSCQVVE